MFEKKKTLLRKKNILTSVKLTCHNPKTYNICITKVIKKKLLLSTVSLWCYNYHNTGTSKRCSVKKKCSYIL